MSTTVNTYNSVMNNQSRARFNFATDDFFAMLTTADYVPDTDAHAFRSDVTDEISGTGYSEGGKTIPVSIEAIDAGNDRMDITIGPVSWTGLTADGVRRMVVYKRRGGPPSSDELVFCLSFPSDVNLVSATLTVNASILRQTNLNP
jgi:hypothetical protein